MKIIDAHLHFDPKISDFSETALRSGHLNTVEHLKNVFEDADIQLGVVMGNRNLKESQGFYPDFLKYCVGIDSTIFEDTSINDFISEVEIHLRKKNCVGIKLYPGYCHYYVYDKIFYPFYELAQLYNKPVAIHTGATSTSSALLKYSHPLTLDQLAVEYPNLSIIMCHFGNPWVTDAAAIMEKNKNISADLSGILVGKIDMDKFLYESKEYINHLKIWINYVGDYDRFMYGTDWPLVNIPDYIEFISNLIPKEYHEKVFFHNANRIYNLGL